MNRRTKLISLVVSILCLSAVVFAQTKVSDLEPISGHGEEVSGRAVEVSQDAPDRQTTGTPRRGGWVIAAYMGGAGTADSSLRVSQPALDTDLTFERLRFRSRSFDPPLYYGLRGGYFIPRMPFFGVEAEFIHLKVFSNPQQQVRVTGLRSGTPSNGEVRLGEVIQQYSISHGLNFLLFNAALRHGVKRSADAPDGRLVFTARVGAGPTLPHTESSIEGQRQEQYELGRLGWQLAGGAGFKLWRGLYALGEYKFTRTRQRGKVFSGTAESLFRTHHGVFGLSYHF